MRALPLHFASLLLLVNVSSRVLRVELAHIILQELILRLDFEGLHEVAVSLHYIAEMVVGLSSKVKGLEVLWL